MVQYPLDMGKPGARSTAVISVDVDENGEVRYDAIVKHGGNQKKIVQTSLSDMKEKKGTRGEADDCCVDILFASDFVYVIRSKVQSFAVSVCLSVCLSAYALMPYPICPPNVIFIIRRR